LSSLHPKPLINPVQMEGLVLHAEHGDAVVVDVVLVVEVVVVVVLVVLVVVVLVVELVDDVLVDDVLVLVVVVLVVVVVFVGGQQSMGLSVQVLPRRRRKPAGPSSALAPASMITEMLPLTIVPAPNPKLASPTFTLAPLRNNPVCVMTNWFLRKVSESPPECTCGTK
jgi:hypothetical protein